MKKTMVKKTKKHCHNVELDKMIWGIAAFLGLAYMVIITAPKLSGN